MPDEPKIPPKPPLTGAPQPQPAPAPAPREAPPVAEREPLTITVVEPEPATVTVQPQVRVEAPPSIEVRRSPLGWLLVIGAVLLFVLYRLQLSPLIQRFEHGVQRRVLGQREYDAHRDPHSRFDQLPRMHDDDAHR